jgi:hypothetical protein
VLHNCTPPQLNLTTYPRMATAATCTPPASAAYWVLIGGEAPSQHGPGVAYHERNFEHTSVSFVGEAYSALRKAGVPRIQIITIVQLQDYLEQLRRGAQRKPSPDSGESIEWVDNGIPAAYYESQLQRTEAACQLLLDEGGADYDFEDVNPSTVWEVLLGEQQQQGQTQNDDGSKKRFKRAKRIIPSESSAPIFFAIYSHGDTHSAMPAKQQSNSQPPAASTVPNRQTTEWYAHLPYPSCRHDIYDFVATEGGCQSSATTPGGAAQQQQQQARPPDAYSHFYVTQLRLVLLRLFERRPDRPVVGLLNYCLSGGGLDFLNRPEEDWMKPSSMMFGSQWPLMLMASSQATTNSLVGGLWSAYFSTLQSCSAETSVNNNVGEVFRRARALYFHRNSYELSNEVKSRVYVPRVRALKFEFGRGSVEICPWHLDLARCLTSGGTIDGKRGDDDTCTGEAGGPNWAALRSLQKEYETGEAFRLIRLTDCSASRKFRSEEERSATKALRRHEEEALLLEFGGFARIGGADSDSYDDSEAAAAAAATLPEESNEVVVWKGKRWHFDDGTKSNNALSHSFQQQQQQQQQQQTSSRRMLAALSAASSPMSTSSSSSKEALSATAAQLTGNARSEPYYCKVVQYRGPRPPPGRAHAELLCDVAKAASSRIATPVAATGRGSLVEELDFATTFLGALPH